MCLKRVLKIPGGLLLRISPFQMNSAVIQLDPNLVQSWSLSRTQYLIPVRISSPVDDSISQKVICQLAVFSATLGIFGENFENY